MKLPKYVQHWVDHDGRAHCYFRRPGYPRVRLPGLPWSPSFMAAYEAAFSGPRAAIGAGRIRPGSVSAVVAEYLDSQQFFASKSPGTQRMRRGILERFRAAYGDRPFALLPPEWIEALLDAKPPHAARSWLVTLRSLCQFAVKRGFRRDDPTRDIKQRSVKGDGFHTWTDDEIAQFEAHHPVGSKPRLAFALLLYTTQRRMGRQHIRETQDGPALYVKQRKTGVELLIPIYPELQTALNATPSEHLTFLVTESAKPYGDNYFSASFRGWCDEAGLPKRCSAHGLRKASCRRMAEASYSANEIMAHSGHTTMKELIRYTKAADQARLAAMRLRRRSSDDPSRVHHAAQRRGSMAACGTGAAAGDAGSRISR
jgi:site-specific recombinase XerD